MDQPLAATVPFRQLAPRLQWLEGRDVLAALRLLPTPTEASLRQQITRAVDLRFRDLKSWRMLGELRVSPVFGQTMYYFGLVHGQIGYF